MTTLPTSIVDQLFDVADEAGVQRALELLSDDVTWTQYDIDNRPAAPIVAHGRDEVEVLLRKGMAPGMTHRALRMLAADDGIACHVECSYPDGAKVECTYLMRLDGDQVVDVLGTMCWDG